MMAKINMGVKPISTKNAKVRDASLLDACSAPVPAGLSGRSAINRLAATIAKVITNVGRR